MKSAFSEWLEKEYLRWRVEQGRRAGIGDFAKYLDISRSLLDSYLNRGSIPSDANIARIAAKLGPEIYDVCDIPRPDPRLSALIRDWGSFNNEVIEAIFETLARFGFGSSIRSMDKNE